MFSNLFNAVIQMHELREIYISGGQFTWTNNQRNPTLEKLDRILMSSAWENRFPSVQVHKLPREVSDHDPLIISTRHTSKCRK
jgi:endonuclease/exonuclease/phosphatase family metal-dependent hydrolase